jgi:hypothetical protein
MWSWTFTLILCKSKEYMELYLHSSTSSWCGALAVTIYWSKKWKEEGKVLTWKKRHPAGFDSGLSNTMPFLKPGTAWFSPREALWLARTTRHGALLRCTDCTVTGRNCPSFNGPTQINKRKCVTHNFDFHGLTVSYTENVLMFGVHYRAIFKVAAALLWHNQTLEDEVTHHTQAYYIISL